MQKILTTFAAIIVLVSTGTFTGGKAVGCPKYTGEPKKFGSIHIRFEDTTTVEYQLMKYKLDSFYRAQVARGFNGSVLIGYQGHIIYERYFGYADKGANRKLTPDASVQLASTSKTF